MGWLTKLFGGKPEAVCSFCNLRQSHEVHLVAGPGVYLCEGCCQKSLSQIDEAEAGGKCSFCNRHAQKAGQFVESFQGTLICRECLSLASDIFEKENP